MDHRIAFLASSVAEVRERLAVILAGAIDLEGVHVGNARVHRELLGPLAGDDEMCAAVTRWLESGRIQKVLGLWSKGLEVDWTRIPRAIKPRVISLPGYPFARERFWVPATMRQALAAADALACPESPVDLLPRTIAWKRS